MIPGLMLGLVFALPPPQQDLRWRESFVARARAGRETFGGGTIVVGSQRLVRCTIVVRGYCGTLRVPLNWLDRSEGSIAIRYQWLPARSGKATGTIVAEEGGPGYSTTGTGFEYSTLFAPLMTGRNLLMMDQRGTGGSEAIDCIDLQPYGGSGVASVSFGIAVERCGKQLNRTYRDARGRFVHASDLFGTSQSVRDLAAILDALDLPKVDFYGDSYGSFFGQVFAARYPQRLHALVLDSTYPTIHQDPFDRAGQQEIRYGFTQVCARSLACSAAATGSPLERIAQLAAKLDASPLATRTTTPIGTPVSVLLAGRDVWTLLASAGDDPGPYRNLDAAARAYLERADPQPLARLAAWTYYGPTFYSYGYKEYSEGLAIADSCTVYTNPFSMNAPLAQRRSQYASAVAALSPHFGYPLPNADVFRSPDEWYDNCLRWPAPVHDDPIVAHGPPLVPKTLPVLVLSGDLDETTSPGDNRQAAAALGPSVTFVTLPNEIHAPALLDPFDCASAIVRRFVVAPGSADTRCTASIPEIRTAGVFALRLSDVVPARAGRRNAAGPVALRLASVAVQAIGDAVQGAGYAYEGFHPNCGAGYCGPGLRGGAFAASGDLHRIALQQYAFTIDTVVTGNAFVSGALLPGDPGFVEARDVTVRTARGDAAAILSVRYDQRVPHAVASVAGRTARGERIEATLPAP